MKRRLLWALLSWLSLLSFGTRAQTTLATETFEGASSDFGYSSNTSIYANDNVVYFDRRAFSGNAYPGVSTNPPALTNKQGSYTWAGESVRNNDSGLPYIRSAGYVVLNPITNSASYKNFVITVAFAAPRGGTYTGAQSNTVRVSDRLRIQYSFNGGAWTTAALLMGNNRFQLDASDFEQITPLSDTVSVGNQATPINQGTVLDQMYRDISVALPSSAIGANLRVRVVADIRNVEVAFDNIRVTGVLDNTTKPTLNGLESTPATYTEGSGTPTQLTSGLTVGYSDNSATNITSATISVDGAVSGQDALNYSTLNGITGSTALNNGVLTLTLTGTASQAAYQAAIRSVTYSNSNTNTLAGSTRTLSFTVFNGSTSSGAATRSLTITPVLNPGTLNYTENFDTDGEGTRYFGNTYFSQAEQAGFFRATTNPPTYNGNTVSTRTYSGFTGAGFWYGEGTELGSNPSTPYSTLQLAPVDASNRVGIKFTIALGAGGSWNGYFSAAAPGGSFELFYRTSPNGTLTKFASFYGNSSDNKAHLDADGDITTPATGTALTTALQDFTFTLPASAASSNLEFLLRLRTGGDVELAFDNIRITAAVAPTVTTTTPSGVTGSTATLGGNITADGGGTLTERGVVYVAGTGTPTTSNTKALVSTSGVTTGAYSGQVSGLSPGTTYTVRAYAINEAGPGYGGSITFTTASTTPTVTTAAPANVAASAATLGGNVTADGGATVSGRGVVYSTTNATPTIGGNGTTTVPNGTGTGSFSATISGLAPGTTYYVQAYATNSNGTVYGGVQTFTTSPALTATVSTTSGSPTSTSPIPFSVSFSQSVGTTFTASDVTVTGAGAPTNFSGSGAGPYTFTVTPTGSSSTVTVSLAAGVAQDANNTGNSASNSVSVFYQQAVTAAPVLTSPANSSTTNSLPTFAGTAPAGSTVTIYLAMGSNTAQPIGTTTATGGNFSLTPATALAAGSYSAYATAQTSGASVSANSNTNAFTVDATAPVVSSSNRQNPAAATTNATSLTFRVTFSEPVTGVDASDFTATTTGTVTSTGRTVSAVSSSAYDVTVSGVSGNGTVRLDLNASGTGITDAVGNPISGGYTSGQTYTLDQTAPAVALSTAAGSPTATAPIPFSATFSEAVTGLAASGISVSNGTVTSGSLSGSGSGPYTFTVTPTGSGTVTVSILANGAQDAAGNGNIASNSVSVTYSSVTTWTAGAGSQDWFTAGNWSAGVPTASTDALIPAGVRFYPLVTAAGAATRALTINSPGSVTLAIVGTLTVNGLLTNGGTITQSAGTLTVNGNMSLSGSITKSAGTISITGGLSNTGTLTQSGGDFAVGSLTNNTSGTVNQTGGTLSVSGDLTNNGTFTTTNAQGTSGGTVLLGGASASSFIAGSQAIRFWNLTVNAGGAQLATSAGASVRNVLTLNGNFAPNSNVFTLESASTGTALVVNNGTNVVTGTTTVQRYIDPSVNPGLGYRHYSAPVSNTTVADLATPTGFTPVVNGAYNTSATPTLERPFPTVFGYDEQRVNLPNNQSSFDRGFVSPTALSDALVVGRGYTVNLGANQLVDFVGSLNTGDRTLSLSTTRANNPDGGWHLVGNPYPAPLNYALVAAADRLNIEGAIYVFSSTSQYGGSYRSSVNGVGGTGIIPLGQGFFVRVERLASSGTLTFRNSQRLTAPANTPFQRPAETRPLVQLTLQGAGSPLTDELYVYTQAGATPGFDAEFDAAKLANPTGLNLAAQDAAGQLFSIDGQPALGTTPRVVPLVVGVPAPGSYSLTATQLLNLSQVPVYLRDLHTGALVDLARQPSYSFTMSSAGAPVTGRFELVFSPQQVLATTPAALAAQVSLYPNPATTRATLQLPARLGQQPVTATLVDAVGRPVRTLVLPAQGALAHQLDLQALATGVYSLRLHTEAGWLVKKLVIE